MAKQLNIDLNVRANTAQAKQEFSNLQKALSDVAVSANKIGNSSIKSDSLKEASAAAKELQRHLSNAVNVDTGKINLNKLNTSLKKSKTNIGELSGKLLSVGTTGEQAFVQLAQSVANAERPVISLGSRINGLLTTFKNTARWQISSTILHGFMGTIQSAYGYAQDLNKSLNNIRIVTGQSVEQMGKFAIEANKAAKSLSTSTTAYTDAALIYYQQGLGDAEVKERTEATIKLANVSRQSAEEVSSQMTAIWNNFKEEGKAVEYYADVITALGATTASSSSEIAEGLSKFASVADTVGLSYEKASAALATVVAETRQSADVVGTAFKTMFARIEGLSQGKTLEDGVGLNKYSEALAKVGVNVLDSNKELKKMDTILDELGAKWNQIDKTQQVALAQTVAGVRQYTQFISLMSNYDKVQKNQTTAEDSEGTVQAQADIYAESWEAASKRAKASLQTIYQDLLDDKFFIAMTNGFSKLMDGLHNFIEGIGGLKGVLIGVGSIFLNYISNKIMPAVQNLKISLITMFQSPEKQAKTYGKIMTDILSAAKQNTGLGNESNMTSSMQTQLNYVEKLSEAKNKLIAMDNKLSDSEKQQAEQALNLISIYQEEVQATADKVTKYQENIDILMDSINAETAVSDLEQMRVGHLKELIAAEEAAAQNYANNKTAKNRQEYEEANTALQNYRETTKNLASDQTLLVEALMKAYEQFLLLKNGMKTFGESSIAIGEVLDGVNGRLTKIGSKDNFKEMRISVADLKKEFRQLGLSDIPEVEDAFSACLKAGNTKQLKAEIEKLKIVLKNVKIEGIDLKELLEKMGESKQVKQLEKEYSNLGKQQKLLEDQQNKLNSAFNNFNPSHVMTIPEIFSKSASAMMQAAMVFNSIKTLLQTWADEDMDPMEKFTTSLMTVGMIVPGVMSGIQAVTGVINGLKAAKEALNIVQTASNALNEKEILVNGARRAEIYEAQAAEAAELLVKEKVIASTEKEAVAEAIANKAKEKSGILTTKQVLEAAASATAKSGEAAATEGATAAQWSLNAAMAANPIGAIIAAAVALVAVLGLLVVAFMNVSNNSPEKALENSAKNADELRQSAEKLEQKAKSLREEFDKYDSVIDKLQSCTKGTKEWREALKEVNKTALELAKEYPELLTNPEYFSKDENGALIITDKGKEYAENAADQKALSAAYASVKANAQKDYDQNTVNYKNIYQATGERSALMEILGNNNEILNSNGDTETLKSGVRNSIKEYYKSKNIPDADINEEALEGFTDKIMECGDDIVKFAEATQKATRQFNTSTDLLISSSEAFENTDITTKNIASNMIQEDVDKKIIENNEKMNTLTGQEKDDEAKRMLNEYKISKGIEEDIIFDKVDKDSNGNKVIKYHKNGEEKESSSANFDELNTSISTYEIGQNIESYAKKAIDAQSGYSQQLQDFAESAANSKNTSDNGKASWDDVLSKYTEKQLEQMQDLSTNSKTLFGTSAENFWKAAKDSGLEGDQGQLKERITKILDETKAETQVLNSLGVKIEGWSVGEKSISASEVSKAKEEANKNGINSQLIDNLIKENKDNDKLPEILDEIGKIKFSDGDATDSLNKIKSKYNLKNVDELIEAVEKIDKVFDVTSVDIAQNVNSAIESSKKIKQDSAIKQEELNTYEALGIETDKYFTRMQDGTYKLTSSAKDFQDAVKKAGQSSLFNLVDNYEKARKQTQSKYFYSDIDETVFSNATYDKSKNLDKNGKLTEEGRTNTAARLDYASSLKGLDLSKVDGGQTLLDSYTKAAKEGSAALQQFWNNLTPEQAEITNQIIDAVDKSFSNTTESILATANSVSELNSLTAILLDNYKSYDYTVYAEQLKGLASQYDNTTNEIEEYNKALASGNEEEIKAAEDFLVMATMAGEAANKYGLVAKNVETHAKLIAEANKENDMSAETAARLAIANERMNKGVKTLNENWIEWSKTLKTSEKTSKDYAETLTDANEALADLTGAIDGASIPLDFLDNTTAEGAKHLEWMAEASEGSAQAINNLGAALAAAQIKAAKFKEYADNMTSVKIDGKIVDLLDLENRFNEAKTYLEDFMDGYQSAVAQGTSAVQSYIDTAGEGWIEALNEMALATDMTTEEMQEKLNEMGIDADLTVVEKTIKTKVPQYTNKTEVTKWDKVHNYPLETKTSTSITGYVDADEVIQVPQINVGKDNKGKAATISYVGTSASSSFAGGVSKSSTTDSSSKKTTSAASHTHEVNRYSNEENAIKSLSDQYARLNKAKDQAFGMGRVHTMELELKQLKELKKASSNYLDAIAGQGKAGEIAKAIYSGKNIGSMISSGQLGGTIRADYNSLYGGLSASGKGVEYSAKDKEGNEWLASDNYSLANFNALFGTNLQFTLDSYGKLENRDSILNLLQNLKNSENSAYASVADPTASSTTEYNRRMAYLDEVKERIEQYDSTADLLAEKTDEYLDYISSIQEKNAEIISTKMETGVNLGQKTIQKLERSIKILGDSIYKAAEAMQTWFDATIKEGIEADKKQGDSTIRAIKEVSQKVQLYEQNPLDENAISPSDAADILSSAEDTLDNVIDSLLQRVEDGKEYFGNVLDYWENKIDNINQSIENNIKILSHLQNILSLLGRETDYEAIGTVLQGQLDSAQSDYASRKAQADVAKQAYERAVQDRERLISQGISDEALEEYDENVLQIAFQNYQEKADAMYQSLEQYIEAANAKFENESNRLFAESENRLTGKWGSFDALDNAMQRQRSVSDEYLTKTNQLYESNTLLRKLSQDIDKTDSRIAKGKLKAFADEIEAMKVQEKLSKTDLEIAKTRYELLQAEIALEDARNAKSTVRLQRDNEGNYGYVYTADQDAVNDAEQNLANKQNDLYNLVLSQAQEYGEKMIQLRKEHDAEVNQLNEDYQNGVITSREEFEIQLQDIEKKYRELEYAEMQSYETAKLWLNRTGAEGQTEAWTNSFDEVITQHRLFNDESENNMTELSNNIINNLDELDSQREYFTEEAKMGNQGLKDTVNQVTSSVQNLSNSVIRNGGLADSMQTAINKAQNLTTAFFNQYDALKDLIQGYSDAANKANNLYNRTVDLINAQVALNHAQNGATSVTWGSGGVSAVYGDGTIQNGNSDYKNVNITPNTTESSNNKQRYAVHDYITGKDIIVTEDEIDQYRLKGAGPSRFLIKKISSYGTPGHFKSGGYTGKWISAKGGMYTGSWNGPDLEENGKLAFLHQKELVLNATDTENMLNAIKLIRQISQTIDLQAATQSSALSLQASQFSNNGQVLQQEVTIHAEFPNATDHNEIEEALSNLVNRAAQFASRQ